MSQMSVLHTTIDLVDKNTLQMALKAMTTMFPDLNTTISGNDIYVHCKDIEQYRKQNLVFKWNGTLFEPVGDTYNTKGNLKKMLTATTIHYRRAAVKTTMGKYGSCINTELQGGIRIRIHR